MKYDQGLWQHLPRASGPKPQGKITAHRFEYPALGGGIARLIVIGGMQEAAEANAATWYHNWTSDGREPDEIHERQPVSPPVFMETKTFPSALALQASYG